MPVNEQDHTNPVDVSVKSLFRLHPNALLRVVGCAEGTQPVRWEDTAINRPETRADHVLIVEQDGNEGAYYVEYQLEPDSRKLAEWFQKSAGLTGQLGMAVVLLVVYLSKRDRAIFPDSYQPSIGELSNLFLFPVVRLWEHREAIESGELVELAPLLVLFEQEPAQQVVRQEITLIRSSSLPEEEKKDLLAIALRVAGRSFARGVLDALFREELTSMQGATIVDDWIQEGIEKGIEERIEQRLAQRAPQIQAEGQAEGARRLARRVALRAVERKFGAVPDALAARIASADAEWCERLVDQAVVAQSWADLDEEFRA